MAPLARRIRTALVPILIVAAAFASGIFAQRLLAAAGSRDPTAASGPDLSMIEKAWGIIDQVYVDRAALQSQALTYGAIEGMVNALGDTGHSTFLTPDMVKSQETFLQGQYGGVGLEIGTKNGFITIVAPIDNSPAIRAGLHAGEEIIKVDGASVAGLPLQEVVRRVSGPPGTKVTLDIFDPAPQRTFSVTLTRAVIKVDSVSWQQIPGTTMADVRVSAFTTGTTDELRTALKEISASRLSGIVLDLRNNPGGELKEAVGVASQFLSGGNVLLEKDSEGATKADPVQPGGLAVAMPLTVLVNGGSASAAEIVAGAIQDQKRGTVIGEKTFGTGTVLGAFKLPDGSEMLLAVREWLTPDGRTIWHTGIEPGVTVALPADAQILIPDELSGMSPKELASSADAQLLRAVQLLQGAK